MSVRPPVFELHIRPMFRLLDREHMWNWRRSFDLWDVNAVWANRHAIATRIKQDMPGTRYGGPYPTEWISVFDRWIATGSEGQVGHHLSVGTPRDGYSVQPLGGGNYRVSAEVEAATEGCQAWLELDAVIAAERHYTLVIEPAYPAQHPQPTLLNVRESFAKQGATRLLITDGQGVQTVPLP